MTERKPPPRVEIKLRPPVHGARALPPPDPRVDGAPAPPPRGKQTTFPDLPSALARRPEQTQVGAAGPPAAGSAPGAPGSGFDATVESADPEPPAPVAERPRRPPRIDSPAPVSQATTAAEREAARLRAELQDALQERDELRRQRVEVEVEQSPLSMARRALLRRLWPWAAGIGATLATSAFGYVKGQAMGYMDAFERVSRIEGAFRTERDRRAAFEGATNALLIEHGADLDRAFAVNRDQDARLGKDDERLKKLEGPIVVHPK